MTDKPHFRFYPRAYEEKGAFKSSQEPCALCAKPCVWGYHGNIYTAKPEPKPLCARCIADGALAKALDPEHWSLQDVEFDDVDAALEREVLQGTPGVACFNPFEWPVHKGKPLVFVGYGDEPAVLAMPGVTKAIAKAFDDEADESPYALVFVTLDGKRYEVVEDMD